MESAVSRKVTKLNFLFQKIIFTIIGNTPFMMYVYLNYDTQKGFPTINGPQKIAHHGVT